MHKYMHHIGDFNSATRFLTRLERSIYLDMMFMYYDTEKPLILDVAALCRKLAAHSDEEKEAVKYVLGEYFVRTDSGYFNARCDEVIREFYDSKSAKSAAGKASAAKREQDKQKRIAELNKQASEGEQEADNVSTDTQQDSTDVQQVLDSVPTDSQQNPTNQEPKTINQYKKNMSDPTGSNDNESPPVPVKPDKNKILNAQAREIFDYWKTVFGKTNQCKFTDDRKNKILARLRDGYDVEQCKRAIDGCSASEYHRTGNYTSIDLIFRNGGNLERFRELPITPNAGMQQPSEQQDYAPQSGAEPETYSALAAEPGNYNPDMYKPAKPFIPEVSNLTPEEQAEAQRRIYEMAEQLKGGK